jgi:hypothetical protein
MQQIIVIVFAGGTVCEAFHILECNTNMVCWVSQRDRVSIGLEKVHIRGVWQKGLRPGQSDGRGSRGASERCVAASHEMKSWIPLVRRARWCVLGTFLIRGCGRTWSFRVGRSI